MFFELNLPTLIHIMPPDIWDLRKSGVHNIDPHIVGFFTKIMTPRQVPLNSENPRGGNKELVAIPKSGPDTLKPETLDP